MARRYRCTQQVLSLPLSGGVKWSRCEESGTVHFKLTWKDGDVTSVRVCEGHAPLIREDRGRLVKAGVIVKSEEV